MLLSSKLTLLQDDLQASMTSLNVSQTYYYGGLRLRFSILYSILIYGLQVFPLSAALPLCIFICPTPTARHKRLTDITCRILHKMSLVPSPRQGVVLSYSLLKIHVSHHNSYCWKGCMIPFTIGTRGLSSGQKTYYYKADSPGIFRHLGGKFKCPKTCIFCGPQLSLRQKIQFWFFKL